MKEKITIDLDTNFGISNPFLKIPFSSIYEPDKSPNKEESSKLMWVITLLYHHQSFLKDLSYEQRIKELESWYVKDKIDLSPYEEEVERFINLAVQGEHWYISQGRKKLEERDNFINQTPYTAESYELLEKLLGNSKKIWDQYLAAEKEMQRTENEGSVLGDIQESATELGLI